MCSVCGSTVPEAFESGNVNVSVDSSCLPMSWEASTSSILQYRVPDYPLWNTAQGMNCEGLAV